MRGEEDEALCTGDAIHCGTLLGAQLGAGGLGASGFGCSAADDLDTPDDGYTR